MGDSQSTFTCSKLTLETLEEGLKYVQSQQKRRRSDAVCLNC